MSRSFVALDFPSWIRWGQRKGASIDGRAQAAIYPDSRYCTATGEAGTVWRCCWCGEPCRGRRYVWCRDACKKKFWRVWTWGAVSNYVYERDGGTCRRCGTTESGTPVGNRYSAWEVDHIVPVKDGGTDDPANLRLLCHTCHVAVGYEQRAVRRNASLAKSVVESPAPSEAGPTGEL